LRWWLCPCFRLNESGDESVTEGRAETL
jgi:hypothetical protein